LAIFGGCARLVTDGGGGSTPDFLDTGRTLSDFVAIQVDPRSEDSAGPQFSAAGDVNGDGLMDVVSAWNQSQPLQLHLQRRSTTGAISFETVNLAGNIPVVKVAGLAIADFNRDERLDIAVLVKHSLLPGASCLSGDPPEDGLAGVIVLYLGPADGRLANQSLAWEEVTIGTSFLNGLGSAEGPPEEGGYTSMAVGDVNADGNMDVVAAWNGACGDNNVLLFTNQGPGQVGDGTWRIDALPEAIDNQTIKDVALADIDGDGDLDVIMTRPPARSMNIRWLRNPTLDTVDDFHISNGEWQVGTVGQIDTGADLIRLGDVDRDGIVDVVVRSRTGGLIQWLKGPAGATTLPVRNIPWQVYTLAEFTERTPDALALGDLDGDGRIEVVVSAAGGIVRFDAGSGARVYDLWNETLIIDELPGPVSAQTTPPTTTPPPDPNAPPGATPAPTPTPTATPDGATVINSIIVVDVDGDGANDLIAPLDRTSLSGLTNDALVWFRNIAP
jgi:hypothetical protein